jgi:hypothetical protein
VGREFNGQLVDRARSRKTSSCVNTEPAPGQESYEFPPRCPRCIWLLLRRGIAGIVLHGKLPAPHHDGESRAVHKFERRVAVECCHGFCAAPAVVSICNCVGLGPSASVARHRVSPSRESVAQRTAARKANPVHRRRACSTGVQGQGGRAQSPELATCQPQFAQRLRYARVGRGGESKCPDANEE